MGIYDTIQIEPGVDLPHLPDACTPSEMEWQTKDIRHPSMDTYKLTADGRLLRREPIHREKTTEEKQAEAADHGFDSWDAYTQTVRDSDPKTLIDEGLPLTVAEQTTEDVWWADHNMHGSFEFYAGKQHDCLPDITVAYEARFNRGDLEDILFLGARHSDAPVDDVIDTLARVDHQ